MGLGVSPPPRLSEVDTSADGNREGEKKTATGQRGAATFTWMDVEGGTKKGNETRRRLIKG